MAAFGWFGRVKSSDIAEGEIRELTNQFHITLRAHFARTRTIDGKPDPETLQRIRDLLDTTRGPGLRWSEAYEVEQLLIDVYDEEALAAESEVRVIEAAKALHPQLAAFYQEKLKHAEPLSRRRSLLARLVNDLQWRYTVNEVKRRYSKDITSRTGSLFAWSLLLFAVATGLVLLEQEYKLQVVPPSLALMIIAALAGTWGATFGMLASLKARLEASELDDMKLMRPGVMLISRALIGTGAGCVLYFLVRSGLLGGDAFPKLEALVQNDFRSLALLIIWCFIAGFAERLVPGILEKNVARITDTISTDLGRYRPDRHVWAGSEQRPKRASDQASKPVEEEKSK